MPVHTLKGGSSYLNAQGQILYSSEKFNGKDFFEKRTGFVEATIVNELLQYPPHPNIVVYNYVKKLDTDYNVSMEEIRPINDSIDDRTIVLALTRAKQYLQSIGIAYIDWKFGNVGINEDDTVQLFDFDFSGLMVGNKWLRRDGYTFKPRVGFNLTNALVYCYEDDRPLTPTNIDDAAFNRFIDTLR